MSGGRSGAEGFGELGSKDLLHSAPRWDGVVSELSLSTDSIKLFARRESVRVESREEIAEVVGDMVSEFGDGGEGETGVARYSASVTDGLDKRNNDEFEARELTVRRECCDTRVHALA